MRIVFLIYGLSFLSVQAQWTDQSLISTVAKYGIDLKNQGDAFNLDGTVISKTSISYAAKSVMTGFDSYFPATLPSSLKIPHLSPDSTHPNLAFWYTPDVFVRDGIVDGALISEWISVANICYSGHADSISCTLSKSANKQVLQGRFRMNWCRQIINFFCGSLLQVVTRSTLKAFHSLWV